MTEPIGSAIDGQMNSDFVERRTMSFSLSAVLAEASQRSKPDPAARDRGMLFLQSTDELGAQVALLQSPIPPAVTKRNQTVYHSQAKKPRNPKWLILTLEPK